MVFRTRMATRFRLCAHARRPRTRRFFRLNGPHWTPGGQLCSNVSQTVLADRSTEYYEPVLESEWVETGRISFNTNCAGWLLNRAIARITPPSSLRLQHAEPARLLGWCGCGRIGPWLAWKPGPSNGRGLLARAMGSMVIMVNHGYGILITILTRS